MAVLRWQTHLGHLFALKPQQCLLLRTSMIRICSAALEQSTGIVNSRLLGTLAFLQPCTAATGPRRLKETTTTAPGHRQPHERGTPLVPCTRHGVLRVTAIFSILPSKPHSGWLLIAPGGAAALASNNVPVAAVVV